MSARFIGADELKIKISNTIKQLDAVEPEWRSKLSDCCLGCSRLETPAAFDLVEHLNDARWLLDGGGYRHYIEEGDSDE